MFGWFAHGSGFDESYILQITHRMQWAEPLKTMVDYYWPFPSLGGLHRAHLSWRLLIANHKQYAMGWMGWTLENTEYKCMIERGPPLALPKFGWFAHGSAFYGAYTWQATQLLPHLVDTGKETWIQLNCISGKSDQPCETHPGPSKGSPCMNITHNKPQLTPNTQWNQWPISGPSQCSD